VCKIVQECCHYEDVSSSYVVQLKTYKKVYGFTVLLIEKPDIFYPFEAAVHNFINIVAMHMENLDNRHTLEERVKKRTEELEKSVKEKDFLMKELNHRVKNNLTMVSSLISLKDLETDEDLSGLKHRIDVIKLVHEKLHRQNDVERIEVKEYFQELLESIFFSTSKGDIDLENSIADVSVPTKTAVPLGLVVNEIATNAIKYGFTSDEKPRFTLKLEKRPEIKYYILTISNTGNPFPDNIDIENSNTLGLRLISSLVKQLDGTITLEKRPSPVFTIQFPLED